MQLSMDGRTDLVDGQRNDVCQKALVTNGERRPAGAVHLASDGGHGRGAWCAKQIEYKERHTGHACENACECCVQALVFAAVENALAAYGDAHKQPFDIEYIDANGDLCHKTEEALDKDAAWQSFIKNRSYSNVLHITPIKGKQPKEA